jgi:hypothetical protein
MLQESVGLTPSPDKVKLIVKAWTDAKFASESIDLELPGSPILVPGMTASDGYWTSRCGTVWTMTAECGCENTRTGGCNCTRTLAGTACEPNQNFETY